MIAKSCSYSYEGSKTGSGMSGPADGNTMHEALFRDLERWFLTPHEIGRVESINITNDIVSLSAHIKFKEQDGKILNYYVTIGSPSNKIKDSES